MAALADFGDDRRIAAEVDRDPVVQICAHVEVRSAAGSLTAWQLEEFASGAEKGVTDIARFTGVAPPEERILIYLSPRVDISHTYPRYPGSFRHEPRVFLDSDRVPDHSAPYLHELVHAVVGDGGAMWLEEGFASWVASSVATKFGGYYAPVLSLDNDRVDAQARNAVERSRAAGDSGNPFATEPRLPSPRERRTFYILSHSFTKFLASSLGTSCLVDIHRADDVHALARVSGVSLDEWQKRWLEGIGEGGGAASSGGF